MKREIESKLQSMLANDAGNNVIIVEGARQVGKSFMVNHVLDSNPTPFLSFDLEKNKKLRRQIDETEDLTDFQALMMDQYNLKKGSILFLDEAQESKRLADLMLLFKDFWLMECWINRPNVLQKHLKLPLITKIKEKDHASSRTQREFLNSNFVGKRNGIIRTNSLI